MFKFVLCFCVVFYCLNAFFLSLILWKINYFMLFFLCFCLYFDVHWKDERTFICIFCCFLIAFFYNIYNFLFCLFYFVKLERFVYLLFKFHNIYLLFIFMWIMKTHLNQYLFFCREKKTEHFKNIFLATHFFINICFFIIFHKIRLIPNFIHCWNKIYSFFVVGFFAAILFYMPPVYFILI